MMYGARRFPKGKAGIAAQKIAFFNRNERQNAATIEVAERSESPLETFGPLWNSCKFGNLKFHFSCKYMKKHAFFNNLKVATPPF